jgi:hypothetical protein
MYWIAFNNQFANILITANWLEACTASVNWVELKLLPSPLVLGAVSTLFLL